MPHNNPHVNAMCVCRSIENYGRITVHRHVNRGQCHGYLMYVNTPDQMAVDGYPVDYYVTMLASLVKLFYERDRTENKEMCCYSLEFFCNQIRDPNWPGDGFRREVSVERY